MTTEDRLDFKFRRIVVLGTMGAAIVALAALLGYFTGLRVLGSIRLDYVPMAPGTACCFLIFSVALFRDVRKPWQGFGLIAMIVLVLFTTVFGLLGFAEVFAGKDLNFDEKLFPIMDEIGKFPVGRMSPAAGATFTITGLGILLLLRGRMSHHARRLGHLASSLGVLTVLAGATFLLAYLYGTPLLYSGSIVPMAATTAIAFVFLGVALVASTGPESFPLCQVTGNSTPALLSRVFLPLTVTAVLLQSILSRSIMALTIVNDALLLAAMVIVIGTITASVVARVARSIGSKIDEVNRKLNLTLNELQASEEKYRLLIENLNAGVFQSTPTGTFLQMNSAVIKMTGYESVEELMSKPESCLYAVPADRERLLEMLMLHNEVRNLELRAVKKDGTHYWISINAVMQKSTDGNPSNILGIVNDITERKLAEEALHRSESHYRSLFENTLFGVAVTNRDFIFIDANDAFCKLLGYEKEELIDKMSIAEVSHQDDAGKSIDSVKMLMKNEIDHYCLEKRYITKAGKTIETLIFVSGMYNSDGEYMGSVAAVLDISERKQAEEDRLGLERQLLHAQKLESLGVLAGGIAHDFNNILMTIIGNADLALRRVNKESPAVENLQQIENAAARAADLAKQMLAYSGKGRFVIENLDLNRLLEEMLHMLELSISKKAVLRFNLTPSLPPVEADATQMRQIIMNLVINASEAIGDKSGVIAITTGCMDCDKNYLKYVWLDENITEGLYVYLEIADTGCGMDRKTMAKVFDPFFTTKFTGRGLGMAAVLGIVRGHKGAIKVYSELGRGTTFKILLPASGKPVEIFNHISGHDDWQGSGTVLLVDDEETVRGIGKQMLQELGFTTITAYDGREAVEVFKSTPDIVFVILDLTMPHMDGEQCFRELRKIKPDVKVIMSSGYNEQEVTQKFVGKGLAGFMQKPYRLSVLKEAITALNLPKPF